MTQPPRSGAAYLCGLAERSDSKLCIIRRFQGKSAIQELVWRIQNLFRLWFGEIFISWLELEQRPREVDQSYSFVHHPVRQEGESQQRDPDFHRHKQHYPEINPDSPSHIPEIRSCPSVCHIVYHNWHLVIKILVLTIININIFCILNYFVNFGIISQHYKWVDSTTRGNVSACDISIYRETAAISSARNRRRINWHN